MIYTIFLVFRQGVKRFLLEEKLTHMAAFSKRLQRRQLWGILFLGKNRKMAVRGRKGSRVRERQDLETTLNVFSHLNMQAATCFAWLQKMEIRLLKAPLFAHML